VRSGGSEMDPKFDRDSLEKTFNGELKKFGLDESQKSTLIKSVIIVLRKT
jgi:hypothetical protein